MNLFAVHHNQGIRKKEKGGRRKEEGGVKR